MISEEDPCTETRELLHAFVEGEIDSIRGRRIEEHLAGCAACTDARRAIEEERLWLMDVLVKGPPLSPRFAEKVTRKIRARARLESARKRSAWALRGAAAVALFSVALVLANRGPSSPEAPLIAVAPGAPEAVELAPAPELAHMVQHVPAEAQPDRPDGMRRVEIVEVFPAWPNAGGRYAIPQNPTEMRFFVDQITPVNRGVPRDPCAPDPNRDGNTDIKDLAYTFQAWYVTAPVALEGDQGRTGAPGEERMPGEPDCDDELCLRA